MSAIELKLLTQCAEWSQFAVDYFYQQSHPLFAEVLGNKTNISHNSHQYAACSSVAAAPWRYDVTVRTFAAMPVMKCGFLEQESPHLQLT